VKIYSNNIIIGQGEIMKKIVILIVLLFLSCNEKSCMEIIQCNPMRQMSRRTQDKQIEEIKDRINKLESENKDKNLQLLGDLYSNLGNKYLEIQQWDPAIEAFKNALKNGRINHNIYYSMGIAYGNRGKTTKNMDDINKAQSFYEKSLELEPGFYSAGYGLAILLFFEKNEKEKAIAILENITAKHRSFYIGRFALGRFYYETDELIKALNIYELLCSDLENVPDSEIIIEYRAQCRENLTRIRSEF
jgi:tetratricopeptide (TPR) repeat protein